MISNGLHVFVFTVHDVSRKICLYITVKHILQKIHLMGIVRCERKRRNKDENGCC